MCPIRVRVFFLCKLCGRTFPKVEKYIIHKKCEHSYEFKNSNCIVFLEGPIPSNSTSTTPTNDQRSRDRDHDSTPLQRVHSSSGTTKEKEEAKRVNNLPVITNVYSLKPETVTLTDDDDDDIPEVDSSKQETCSVESDNSDSGLIQLANPDVYLDPALRLEPEECRVNNLDLSNFCQVKLEDNFILGDLYLPSTSKFTLVSGTGSHAPFNSKIISSAAPTATAQQHFQCNLCSKLLKSSSQLKIHVKVCAIYHKNRSRFCAPCNEVFLDSLKLRQHNRRLHPTREDKADKLNVHESQESSKMKCNLCPQEFVDTAEFCRHVNLHKKKKIPIDPAIKSLFQLFTCEFCSLFFQTANQLTEHLSYHSDDFPFRCSHLGCLKAFKLKSDFQKHLNTH